MLSREEVTWAYRLLLEREPESDSVISEKQQCPSLHDLVSEFLQSHEFKNRPHAVEPQPQIVLTDVSEALKTGVGKFGPSDLDHFVACTDQRGAVGSPAIDQYWSGLTYEIETQVDETLSPYSDEYVAQQVALYTELSGRDLNQYENELCSFNLVEHVAAANPYAHQPPHALATHFIRLSHALAASGLRLGEHLLDVGCGWGLSSELFAYSGLQVTALDINPNFVELVRQRAENRKLAIRAVHGAFEDLPAGPFDAVAYYECLHHAVKPWEALQAACKVLRTGGKLILSGEPVNDQWKHWGLRTDPYSLYCIHKHGWFESGWSLSFLKDCIEKCGFSIRYSVNEGGATGWIIIGEKN